MTGFGFIAEAKERPHGNGGGWLGSAVLAVLLFSEVASAMVGAEMVFFSAVVAAWFILPAIVGLRSVLDAGGYFMLVSLGIVVVVDVAHHGPGSLLT